MVTGEGMRLDRAGRVVAGHAMVWTRYLRAPVAAVWPEISTKAGLEAWWIAPPTAFELRVGGRFHHHWEQTVLAFEDHRFIDFDEPAGLYPGTGGMRFEVAARGERETAFAFLATWGPDVVPMVAGETPAHETGADDTRADETGADETGVDETGVDETSGYETQAAGPGSPWPSVAAGWHAAVDDLERLFSDDVPDDDYQSLCAFYQGYLTEQFRWLERVRRTPATASG